MISPRAVYFAAAKFFRNFRIENVISTVPKIITKESALITGDTPKRIIEYTYSGSVVEPGPDTKKVMTKSSSDMVTAIKNPDKIPGKMAGTITLSIACRSVAPKSYAASTMEKSNSSMRARIIKKTNGRQKVVCAAKIENKPSGSFMPEKKITVDTPIITSGKTMGKKLIVWI